MTPETRVVLEGNDYKGFFAELSSAIMEFNSLVDSIVHVNFEKLEYVQKGGYFFNGDVEMSNNITIENCEFKTSFGDWGNALIDLA